MAAFGRYRKAGLPGLFVCLMLGNVSPGTAQVAPPWLQQELDKYQGLPKPRKSLMPPLRLQVEKAEATYSTDTREPVVVITLAPRAARMFHDLTLNNIGRVLVLRIDGQIAAEPIIREAIAKGVVQISGSMTMKDAADLAVRLSKGESKIEVELVDG